MSNIFAPPLASLPNLPASTDFFDPGAPTPLTPIAPVAQFNPIQTLVSQIPFAPNQNIGNTPLNARQPQNQSAFASKYANADVSAALSQLPDAIAQQFMAQDAQRVSRGQAPLPNAATIGAAQTLLTGQQATPPPTPNPFLPTNILKNTVGDIRAITTNIPQIPLQLYREAKALPNLPSELGNVHSLQDLANVPGIRMIPGVQTVANLTGGMAGLQREFEHPVMSALDVLPFAQAKVFAPAAVAAEDAAKLGAATAATATGEAASETASQLAKRSAIDVTRQAFSNTPFGAAVNQVGTNISDWAMNTRPGQILQEAFGPEARRLSMTKWVADSQLRDMLDPNSSIAYGEDALVDTARAAKSLSNDFAKTITPERQAELVQQATTARSIADIPNLTDPEAALLTRYKDMQSRLMQQGIDNGTLAQIDGEIFDKQTAARIMAEKDPTKRAALISESPPARFLPLVQDRAAKQLALLDQTPENTARVAEAVAKGTYAQLPGELQTQLRTFTQDIAATWQDLRAQGYDPVFVHSVSPGQEGMASFPHVLDHIPNVREASARALDATPSASSFSIALDHQAMQYLTQRQSRAYIDTIGQAFGRNDADVINELMPTAERMARANPAYDVNAMLDRLVRQRFVEFNPESLVAGKPAEIASLSDLNGTRTLLPRTIFNNIRRMETPMKNGITATLDPVMKVFRTSVLPLSPRWHFNNLFGNMLMLMGESGPEVFKYYKNAVDLMKRGETELGGKTVALPDYLKMQLQSSTDIQREMNMASSNTMGRLMREAGGMGVPGAEAGAQVAERAGQATAPLKAGFNKVINMSYKAQGFVDDSMRAMGYLYGYDKALTKGMTQLEAEAAGEAVARRAFQTWGELTPIERSVMRYAFPFYGFTQHIVRYAFRYPFDHPFRTSILSSFANNELKDHANDGMPLKFLNGFFFGHADAQGNIKQFNIAGMNPFKDVANYFTLAGVMGGSNPVIKSFFEAAGVDTQTGGPELYPNMAYDPQTGRLSTQGKSFFGQALANTLPQSQILTGLASNGSEFRQLMQTNPDAARNLLRSQLGLPVLYKNVNIPTEVTQEEQARQQAENRALSDAIKTGNYSGAQQYPGLAPALDQLRTLSANGSLAQYEPPSPSMTPLQIAQDAIIKMNVPPTAQNPTPGLTSTGQGAGR